MRQFIGDGLQEVQTVWGDVAAFGGIFYRAIGLVAVGAIVETALAD